MKSQQKQELDGIIDKIIGYFRFHDRKERMMRRICGNESTVK